MEKQGISLVFTAINDKAGDSSVNVNGLPFSPELHSQQIRSADVISLDAYPARRNPKVTSHEYVAGINATTPITGRHAVVKLAVCVYLFFYLPRMVARVNIDPDFKIIKYNIRTNETKGRIRLGAGSQNADLSCMRGAVDAQVLKCDIPKSTIALKRRGRCRNDDGRYTGRGVVGMPLPANGHSIGDGHGVAQLICASGNRDNTARAIIYAGNGIG